MTNTTFYSLTEVAKLFNRSPKSIWRWHAKENNFPKPLKRNGRTLGFNKKIIDEYINNLSEQTH